MKRILCLLLALTFLILTACVNESQREEDTSLTGDTAHITDAPDASEDSQTQETAVRNEEADAGEVTTVEGITLSEYEEKRDIAVVYFSHKDTVGSAAEYISEKTNGTLIRVEALAEYPEDEGEYPKKAAEQHRRNARPALKSNVSLTGYEIVFLCFPVWDGTMPMVLFTLLEDCDMRSKAVIPVVCGNEKGLDTAIKDMHMITPEMTVVNGYRFTDDLLSEKAEVDKWIADIIKAD